MVFEMDAKLCSVLLVSAFLTMHLYGEVSSQNLHQVQAEQIPPVRVGGVARFRCSFLGDNITMQYISWTKFVKNGRRTFVYEYSQHPPLARPYYDFIGRATITNADMNDNRYSYLNDISYDPISAPQDHANDANVIMPMTEEDDNIEDTITYKALPLKGSKRNEQNAVSDHWSSIHESIYGLFSDVEANGEEGPSHKDIDDVFEGIEDKQMLTHKIKRLKPPVSRSDIERALYPYNTQELRTIPMRWSNFEAAGEESPFAVDADVYDDYVGDAFRLRRRRKRRAVLPELPGRPVPVHHIDLQLVHVLLSDEATYECLVKPVNGPAVSSSMRLFVQVPPTTPLVEENVASHADGSNVSLTCRVNAGKPAGEVRWTRRKLKDAAFHEVPEEMYDTEAHLLPNYTTSITSRLQLQLTASDDGATYRCSVHSALSDDTEVPRFAQISMTVSYPPRGGRILFDTAEGRYYCHARGKPTPSYSWVWLRADGRQTVMSNNRYLDLSGMQHSGYYRFHCLASNNIQGIKHTKVMATKLRVIAPDINSIGLDREVPSMKYWRRRTISKSPAVITTLPPTTTTTTLPPTTTTTTLPPTTTTTTLPPTTTTTTLPPTTTTTTTTLPPTTTTTTPPHLVAAGVAAPLIYPGGFPESASRQLIPTFDVTGQKSLGTPSGERWENLVEPAPGDAGKDPDYYYYYFYDDGRKEPQPANFLNRHSPWAHSAIPGEREHVVEATYPPTQAPPTELPVHQYAEKNFDWEALNKMGADLGLYMEPLPELDDKLNTNLKEPVPYNPFNLLHYGAPEPVVKDRSSNQDSRTGSARRSEKDKNRNRKQRNYRKNDNEARRRPKKGKSSKYHEQARSNKYEKVMMTSTGEFDCGRHRTGTHGVGCRAFYRCVGGRTYSVSCRHPYVYNKNTEKCGEPKAAPAPCGKFRDCSKKPSRKYVDENSACKYYYTCYRGFFMGHNECNPGLVFNEEIQLCDWPANVKDECSASPKKKKRTPKRNRRYRE